jgi:hypothetical protein
MKLFTQNKTSYTRRPDPETIMHIGSFLELGMWKAFFVKFDAPIDAQI